MVQYMSLRKGRMWWAGRVKSRYCDYGYIRDKLFVEREDVCVGRGLERAIIAVLALLVTLSIDVFPRLINHQVLTGEIVQNNDGPNVGYNFKVSFY